MSKGYKKGPYSPIQWALSSAVGFFATQCAHTALYSSWSLTILCRTQWMSSSLATSAAECVYTPRIICSGHAWCPGHYLSTYVLPLLKAMHHIYACFQGITHNPYTFTNWCYTHHTQKSKRTSYFKDCHGSGRPSIFNLTYLSYPLMAVQWHNLHVPITCLNLQSHDTISCQTYCYLIVWNLLVYLSEAENSKYDTRNTSTTGSTTGMNKDMPLILDNNNAGGVTEVREITWFYK